MESVDEKSVSSTPNPAGVFISQDEKKLLDKAKLREEKDYKVQMDYERNFRLFKFEKELGMMERLIAFKQSQIDTGVVIEKDENMRDGLKHPDMLRNDIDQLVVQKRNVEVQRDTLLDLVKELRR